MKFQAYIFWSRAKSWLENDEMKQWMDKVKSQGKDRILILVLLGVLLLVIAMPVEDHSGEQQEEMQTEQSFSPITVRRQLEMQLQQVLSTVSGVGKTEVMITLKSDGRRIVEKDMELSEGKEESGQEGSTVSSSQSDSSESTVFQKDAQGNEMPYVSETMEPEIAGVLIVAQGAGNLSTVADITEAVMALFGVEAHKIKVMKMD